MNCHAAKLRGIEKEFYLARIPQLRSTGSARRNPSAAKSMGLPLLADIDRRCCEGMLSLIATTCESAKRL
jgi:hypothetical protein